MSDDFPTFSEIGEENIRSRYGDLVNAKKFLFSGYSFEQEREWKKRREELRNEQNQ
jgi:hypothetical protein